MGSNTSKKSATIEIIPNCQPENGKVTFLKEMAIYKSKAMRETIIKIMVFWVKTGFLKVF